MFCDRENHTYAATKYRDDSCNHFCLCPLNWHIAQHSAGSRVGRLGPRRLIAVAEEFLLAQLNSVRKHTLLLAPSKLLSLINLCMTSQNSRLQRSTNLFLFSFGESISTYSDARGIRPNLKKMTH